MYRPNLGQVQNLDELQIKLEEELMRIYAEAQASSNRGALVYATASQAIPHAVGTIVNFDTVKRDTEGFFNAATSSTRFVIPAGISLVRLYTIIRLENSTSGFRQLQFLLNGAPIIPSTVSRDPAGGLNILSVSSHAIEVVGGDYLEVEAYQNSGAAMTIQLGSTFSVSFSIEVLG